MDGRKDPRNNIKPNSEDLSRDLSRDIILHTNTSTYYTMLTGKDVRIVSVQNVHQHSVRLIGYGSEASNSINQ